MNVQKTPNVLAIAFGFCLLVALFCIGYLLQKDGRIIFPFQAHGDFIQEPTVSENRLNISWILPEKCDYNSYEARDVSYKPDAGMFWGGGDAVCEQASRGYECHADMQSGMRSSSVIIQARGYGCVSGNYYTSQPQNGNL